MGVIDGGGGVQGPGGGAQGVWGRSWAGTGRVVYVHEKLSSPSNQRLDRFCLVCFLPLLKTCFYLTTSESACV